MSKIVRAVNAMVSNPELITDVVISTFNPQEIFFMYAQRHKWSVNKGYDSYFLHYYPGNQSIQELAAMNEFEWENFTQVVTYGTEELSTREAISSMNEIYTIIKGKIYNIDDVLDEIIRTDEIPF